MTQTAKQKVLLCRPTHYRVEYIINPHMKLNSVNQNRAMDQWLGLVDKLESLNHHVEVIEQQEEVPDMVFATDHGLVINSTIFLANFRYPQRQKEAEHYINWFRSKDFKLQKLSELAYFEGGDALVFDDLLFVGVGFRSSLTSCDELARKLHIKVRPLKLVNPSFYHLDMCLLIIDNQTAFYYPQAFTKNSQKVLQQTIPNLIGISDVEAKKYAANSFVCAKDILVSSGMPRVFRKKLQSLGLKIHELNVNEFKKAGGGIHCLVKCLP